jgi:Abortive infection alpha
MTDETRAIAEVANATGEIVRTARDAGGYLAAVFGSVPHDLVGAMGGDWLHETRRRNIAQLQANTDKLLDAIAVERRTEISGSVFLPLIDACIDEGRPELQALWAALLANAMVDGGRKVRRDFFDAVKRMEPADAHILNALGEIQARGGGNADEWMRQLTHEAKKPGISDIDLWVSIEALLELKCFRLHPAHLPEVTPFGFALLGACHPPT